MSVKIVSSTNSHVYLFSGHRNLVENINQGKSSTVLRLLKVNHPLDLTKLKKKLLKHMNLRLYFIQQNHLFTVGNAGLISSMKETKVQQRQYCTAGASVAGDQLLSLPVIGNTKSHSITRTLL